MVGFDSDDLGCFERQFEFGMALPIVNLRVSVLVAPVATPLHAKMVAEGRLVSQDKHSSYPGGNLWTNIEPAQMSRAELADGAIWLFESLYDPDNAIIRFEHVAQVLASPPDHLAQRDTTSKPGKGAAGVLKLFRQSARDPGARRVIDAVTDLSRQRPEIARDLSSVLAIYLNSHTSLSSLARQSSRVFKNLQVTA